MSHVERKMKLYEEQVWGYPVQVLMSPSSYACNSRTSLPADESRRCLPNASIYEREWNPKHITQKRTKILSICICRSASKKKQKHGNVQGTLRSDIRSRFDARLGGIAPPHVLTQPRPTFDVGGRSVKSRDGDIAALGSQSNA